MDMCREEKIHLLRPFNTLLPSFFLNKRSASCATGKILWLSISLCKGKHQHRFQHIITACPWRSPLESSVRKSGQNFVQAGLEMMTPGPPSQLGTSTAPHLCKIHVTKSFVHLDKVASNFKATFILYAIALLFCIPGFMKQRQRKMRWQSAEICRHTCDLP